jgi:hypothetical protein
MIVQVSDFKVGKYELHSGIYDVPRIQAYIDKYEKRYLTELLGGDLFALFEADLTLGAGVPTEARFTAIFEALTTDLTWCILYSEGMKEMLMGFIYYEYTKDEIVQMTPVGNVRPVGQNSEVAGSLYTQIYNRYNDSVRTYKAIQGYIWKNPEKYDYSEFNGMTKGMVTWL